MAYDEGVAQLLRDDLAGERITERKMFGGLCFLLDGNMLCGPYKGGVMFRVGKDNEAAALAIPGARPMEMTGRPMPGMIDMDYDAVADDTRRGRIMALALAFVRSLPAK